MKPHYFSTLLSILSLLLVACGGESERKVGEGILAPDTEKIPLPNREFRAAWVATVDNIDWPSSPDLSVKSQKKEALAILDRLASLNMNAVVFQVRPQADALYQSALEPWSCYLTGEQGKAPDPVYDPLEFWIEEAHKRGIQLHAWFNPYRANHKANKGPISSGSIIKTNPELVVRLGDEGYWWMNPSLEEAKNHTVNVILDVVDRYDIDGVHFDDYFYPYPAYNNREDFPDSTSYAIYQKGGGKLSVGDWRRDSVNRLIKELSPLIKERKPHVEFGISPFGIWRPGHPEGVTGMDQYETLYADARLWIREGWVDYFMPQLYWPIASKNQSFSDLLVWWNDQNLKQRHLWPGLNMGSGEASATETANQVMFTRGVNKESPGVCLFSMKRLMAQDSAGAIALKSGPWAEQALIPATARIDSVAPDPPVVDLIRRSDEIILVRFEPRVEAAFQFVINEKQGDKWLAPKIVPGHYRSFTVKDGVKFVSVRTVDRLRNISAPVVVEMNP